MDSANFAGAELFVDVSSFGDTVANILQEHEKWIKTDGKEGSRADLAGLNMERIDLSNVLFMTVMATKMPFVGRG